ncbi:MAG TPA: peptidoglycan-associated lipoprotein Pal [Solimonas sp.]|nr:peptidoglycan-associated lipoprotein Pal [Solimonas sp.]
MTKNILIASALVLALVATGCSSGKKNTQPAAPAEPVSQGTTPYGDSYGGTAQIGASPSDAAVAAERALSNNVIYFEYDSSAISADGAAVVDRYAAYLQANPASRVRLEGHADERGSREYNVGLGERRAQAVESALQAKGVNANQLALLSYGEERPAVPGHDEAAWAQNRRVQLIRQ